MFGRLPDAAIESKRMIRICLSPRGLAAIALGESAFQHFRLEKTHQQGDAQSKGESDVSDAEESWRS
jgi:hypothetical protein